MSDDFPFFHLVEDRRKERHVRAGENRHADGVDIFLNGGIDDHFRGLAKTGVDDFHAGIAKRGGDDFDPPVMAVESGFGKKYTNFALHRAYISKYLKSTA